MNENASEQELRKELQLSAPIFPKVLPNLVPGALLDELGFTLNEKVALRQAFNQIKPFRRNFGKDIFYTYLVQNEDVIDIFRGHGGSGNEKLNLSSLHRHALTMMRSMHMVINKGLDDLPAFHMMTNDCSSIHVDHWVPKKHVQLLGYAIKDYVLNVMQNRCSVSLVSGFDKILNKFLGCGDAAGKVRQQNLVAFQEDPVVSISPSNQDV